MYHLSILPHLSGHSSCCSSRLHHQFPPFYQILLINYKQILTVSAFRTYPWPHISLQLSPNVPVLFSKFLVFSLPISASFYPIYFESTSVWLLSLPFQEYKFCQSHEWLPTCLNQRDSRSFFFLFFSFFIFYCSEFCHTLKWNSHGFTCVPHPDPPSHLPLHPIPLGLPSAPGPSTCLMHPTLAGDLFHPR